MQNPKRNVMNEIKMNRLELLEIVKGNSVKHIAAYNESVQDYLALVLKATQAALKTAKTGDLEKIKRIKPIPASPKSYEDSYRRGIRMLELSVDDVIEVQEDVFNQLVLDEWQWKHAFEASSSMYKSGF